MRRKVLTGLILTISFFTVLVLGTLAQTNNSSETYPIQRTSQIFGQNHYYSVVFRGNGEAVVNLKVVLSNLEEKTSLSEVLLRVPKVIPKDISVYQVIMEKRCLRYGDRPVVQSEETSIYPPIISPKEPTCVEYGEPDYFQYGYGNKYQRAEAEYQGDTIKITLPQPIKPNQSGSFVLYFRGLGYAKKDLFGVYNYNFETLKIEDKINSLNIGIGIDADLYLAGVKGRVVYQFDEGVMSSKAAVAGQAFSNSRLDQYYQQIGSGVINKNASNLQPLESYSVKGSYADSKLKLYGKKTLFGLLLTTIILLFLIWLIKFLVKRFSQKMVTVSSKGISPILISIGSSFLSAGFILSYTIVVILIIRYLNMMSYYDITPLLIIVLSIVSIGVYSLLLFLPALFVGIKKGIVWGVATFILTIFWLAFFTMIIFLLFF